ncbi:MAG: alkylation response protein AidB-like acyl-CoA dehydrogenase [Polaribacter sp.]|jgi:alkylation response protein AidB-like acyl-CoA dehydrogenase
MELQYNHDQLKFKQKVRSFLKNNLSYKLSQNVKLGLELEKTDIEEWHAVLNKKGWLATHWPEEYGGTNWSPIERHIFEEECCFAFAPRTLPFGINMLAPVILAFGTEKQKQHFLPRILNGQDWWCQGFSEPDAGSDLASLKTKAVLENGEYLVNGQKTWTTLGQHANWIFCLVRTSMDGKPQTGISFLLIDLSSPGVEMKPIKLLDGSHEVNEVFFQDVRVPVDNLIGEENKGWDYAKYLLTYERTNIAGVAESFVALEQLKVLASKIKQGNGFLVDNHSFASKLADIEIRLNAMNIINLKVLSSVQAGKAPGVESSMLKIKGTEIQQQINDLTRQALGPYAPSSMTEINNNFELEQSILYDDVKSLFQLGSKASKKYLNNRKLSIFGGSNEIQKSIIAKQLLKF